MRAILRYLRRKVLIFFDVCPTCCIPIEFHESAKPFCGNCHQTF